MKYDVEPIVIARETPGALEYQEFGASAELCGAFWRAAKSAGTPKLSVAIMSHRNLDALRQCVKHVLTYAHGIDYELVLMDNASDDNDETCHYMRTVPHKRKTVLKMLHNMGPYFNAARGWNTLWNHCTGDYILHLNDDHFVTENAVQNMIQALDHNPSVGMVNPKSSNAWMGQDPKLSYRSHAEMLEAAKNFNVYDPRKWEERIYVAAVAWMFRREVLHCLQCSHPFGPELCYDIALRVAGYRVMLLGDTWVHHHHDYSQKESYGFAGDTPEKKQQRDFIAHSTRHLSFGLTMFEDICVFEKELVSMITPPPKPPSEIASPGASPALSPPRLLAVDVRAGQGLLDLKNHLRLYDIFQTQSTAFSTQAKYYPLLYTIADDVLIDRIDLIGDILSLHSFDYCIAGTPINDYPDQPELLSHLIRALNPGGQLVFKWRHNAAAPPAPKVLRPTDSVDPDTPLVQTIQALAQDLIRRGHSNLIIHAGACSTDLIPIKIAKPLH